MKPKGYCIDCVSSLHWEGNQGFCGWHLEKTPNGTFCKRVYAMNHCNEFSEKPKKKKK